MARYRDAERAREALAALSHRGLDAATFIEAAATVLQRAISFDGACWVTMDPATLLVTGHIQQGPFELKDVARLAHFEYLEEDVLQFPALARGSGNAGALRQVTGGHPERSARYRELLLERGVTDELRGAFVDGARCWGAAALYRRGGRASFETAESELLAAVVGYMAQGLRCAIVLNAVPGDTAEGPGVVVLDAHNAIESMTPSAEAWLRELTAPGVRATVPAALYAVASRARRIGGAGREAWHGVARARIRAPSGRWLVLHGSLMETRSGMRTAVIIESAGSGEIAPLVLDAYPLTEREREVVRWILHGRSTNEIAKGLFISPYTVQDHLKVIFDKVGVRSRRELTAQVFFRHYAPEIRHADNLTADGWFLGDRGEAAA
jgi:DNA-binding CsgD family transcriptional regulator